MRSMAVITIRFGMAVIAGRLPDFLCLRNMCGQEVGRMRHRETMTIITELLILMAGIAFLPRGRISRYLTMSRHNIGIMRHQGSMTTSAVGLRMTTGAGTEVSRTV